MVSNSTALAIACPLEMLIIPAFQIDFNLFVLFLKADRAEQNDCQLIDEPTIQETREEREGVT